MERPGQVTLFAVPGLPEIREGDNLADLISACLERASIELVKGDILVIAHKIVSKAEGRVVSLADVEPSLEALELADQLNKDPRKLEVILQESVSVLRAKPPRQGGQGVMICEHRLGLISANAAVDESNVPGEDMVVLLPMDPDASARQICGELQRKSGAGIGVIIADTFGRPWRVGLVNVAIGLAGVPAVKDCRGGCDREGLELKATIPAFADEVASAAGLLMGKADGLPVIGVRGLRWEYSDDSATMLLRAKEEDLFL